MSWDADQDFGRKPVLTPLWAFVCLFALPSIWFSVVFLLMTLFRDTLFASRHIYPDIAVFNGRWMQLWSFGVALLFGWCLAPFAVFAFGAFLARRFKSPPSPWVFRLAGIGLILPCLWAATVLPDLELSSSAAYALMLAAGPMFTIVAIGAIGLAAFAAAGSWLFFWLRQRRPG